MRDEVKSRLKKEYNFCDSLSGGWYGADVQYILVIQIVINIIVGLALNIKDSFTFSLMDYFKSLAVFLGFSFYSQSSTIKLQYSIVGEERYQLHLFEKIFFDVIKIKNYWIEYIEYSMKSLLELLAEFTKSTIAELIVVVSRQLIAKYVVCRKKWV